MFSSPPSFRSLSPDSIFQLQPASLQVNLQSLTNWLSLLWKESVRCVVFAFIADLRSSENLPLRPVTCALALIPPKYNSFVPALLHSLYDASKSSVTTCVVSFPHLLLTLLSLMNDPNSWRDPHDVARKLEEAVDAVARENFDDATHKRLLWFHPSLLIQRSTASRTDRRVLECVLNSPTATNRLRLGDPVFGVEGLEMLAENRADWNMDSFRSFNIPYTDASGAWKSGEYQASFQAPRPTAQVRAPRGLSEKKTTCNSLVRARRARLSCVWWESINTRVVYQRRPFGSLGGLVRSVDLIGSFSRGARLLASIALTIVSHGDHTERGKGSRDPAQRGVPGGCSSWKCRCNARSAGAR